MDEISEEHEMSINRMKQNKIRNMFAHINNGYTAGRDGETPELMKAKSLTAGYLEYIRANIKELSSKVVMSDEAMEDCNVFALFVAYFRSRPPKRQDEENKTRELSTRLVGQLTKLAYVMSVVMNRTEVDKEVMRRVRQVALDTSRGNTLNIIKHLIEAKDKGLEWKTVASLIGTDDKRAKELLRFLMFNGVVETFRPSLARGVVGITRYRVTDKIRRIYNRVVFHPSFTTHKVEK
jgi:hypothetical protein